MFRPGIRRRICRFCTVVVVRLIVGLDLMGVWVVVVVVGLVAFWELVGMGIVGIGLELCSSRIISFSSIQRCVLAVG